MADTALFPERIETERLRLEAITGETAPLDLYEYVGEDAPDVEEETRYVTWNPHETPKETAEFVEAVAAERREGEGGTYLLYPRDGEDGAGELAGTAGLSVNWDRRCGELGIWLRKPFWGRGYSGERAGALLDVAFERLDLDLVEIPVRPDNEKSRRAVETYVESYGGRHEGLLRNARVTRDGTVVDLDRYTISQVEYREATE
jgi:RimJ/RimL family protein N-acetyltransferase